MYDAFMLTNTILQYEDRVKYLRSVLIVLPKYSQILLRQTVNLLQHVVRQQSDRVEGEEDHSLHRVASRSVSSLDRISSVFGPILFRPKEKIYYMQDDQQLCFNVVKILIEEHENLMKIIDNSDGPMISIGLV
eukprot:TRINITY_DN4244_c0_g1_i3.p1 TRINITY_DN4244_c0_g1~~TRINITY_DN4244_c0_g1_i3.p1  ORF type:complete len:147 (-),score=49.96 TRINITY_DN4244_c0_g1_i3:133-531(-)